jgi:hypothetical protein
MAPKGKTAVSKEKKAPVITGRRCASCSNPMASNDITTILSININEAGSAAKRYIHRHKKCS